eukprot:364101-Chlamydomonas_euryale.AAC.4
MSTWMPRAAETNPRPTAMLRRLGLATSADTPSIAATVATIVDTVNKLYVAGTEGERLRSEPPAVPAPPTLAPEPLMLSPLQVGFKWMGRRGKQDGNRPAPPTLAPEPLMLSPLQ